MSLFNLMLVPKAKFLILYLNVLFYDAVYIFMRLQLFFMMLATQEAARTYTVIKHFLSHVFIFSRILASHVDYDCVCISLFYCILNNLSLIQCLYRALLSALLHQFRHVNLEINDHLIRDADLVDCFATIIINHILLENLN